MATPSRSLWATAAAFVMIADWSGEAFVLTPTFHSHVLCPSAMKNAFLPQSRIPHPPTTCRMRESGNANADEPEPEPVDMLSFDPRFYRVRVSRAPGIDWGTDLSFRFVYVRDVDPSGAAAGKGVRKGDQLCELQTPDASVVQNLVGAPFAAVMSCFANLDPTVREMDLVLFRGTLDELKNVIAGGDDADAEPKEITVTVVVNKGAPNESVQTLTARPGVNLRKLLVDHGINVYQSLTRWTNCGGKQLCGTCIVNVTDGLTCTNRKSTDEASTLRENPESYRLSCITFAYGDVTVETFPPIGAAQWTR